MGVSSWLLKRWMKGGVSAVTYKEMVVGRLLDELLAVDDGLVEGGAESDGGHFVGGILYTVSSATSYRRLCLCLSY